MPDCRRNQPRPGSGEKSLRSRDKFQIAANINDAKIESVRMGGAALLGSAAQYGHCTQARAAQAQM